MRASVRESPARAGLATPNPPLNLEADGGKGATEGLKLVRALLLGTRPARAEGLTALFKGLRLAFQKYAMTRTGHGLPRETCGHFAPLRLFLGSPVNSL